MLLLRRNSRRPIAAGDSLPVGEASHSWAHRLTRNTRATNLHSNYLRLSCAREPDVSCTRFLGSAPRLCGPGCSPHPSDMPHLALERKDHVRPVHQPNVVCRELCGAFVVQVWQVYLLFFPNSVSLEDSNGGKQESLIMIPQRGPAPAFPAVRGLRAGCGVPGCVPGCCPA